MKRLGMMMVLAMSGLALTCGAVDDDGSDGGGGTDGGGSTDGGGGSDGGGGICTTGHQRCTGDWVETCTGDAWTQTVDCSIASQTCSESGTTASCSAAGCTDGHQRCTGDWVETCASGGWTQTTDCSASSQTCTEAGTSASCTASGCTDGHERCTGDWVETCTSGSWTQTTDCSASSQTCTEAGITANCTGGGTCTNGQRRCTSNDVELCVGAVWTTETDCAGNGQICVDGVPPTCEDVTCDPNLDAAGACGGALPGLWHFAGICSDGSVEQVIQQACANATLTDEQYAYSGTLDFDSPITGQVTRNVDITTTLAFTVPKTDTCFIVGGGTCTALGTALTAVLDSATCTDTGANCDCTGSLQQATVDSAAYTAASGTVTVEGRTWYYCVDGQQVSFKEYGGGAGEDWFTQVYVR